MKIVAQLPYFFKVSLDGLSAKNIWHNALIWITPLKTNKPNTIDITISIFWLVWKLFLLRQEVNHFWKKAFKSEKTHLVTSKLLVKLLELI